MKDNAVFALTRETFRTEVLDSETPVLIDFWAPWCGPCRAMGPILDEVAQKLAGKVRVAKVNVDEQQELAGAFGIRSIPTCVLMKGDQALAGFVGVTPAAELAKQVLEKIESGS